MLSIKIKTTNTVLSSYVNIDKKADTGWKCTVFVIPLGILSSDFELLDLAGPSPVHPENMPYMLYPELLLKLVNLTSANTVCEQHHPVTWRNYRKLLTNTVRKYLLQLKVKI